MKKLNKEYNMGWSSNIPSKMGTVNKDNPQVIYICGRTWLTPSNNISFADEMLRLKHRFSRMLNGILSSSNFFHTKTVLDFDINTDNLELQKKKFLSFEFFVRQKGFVPIKDLKSIAEDTFRPLIIELDAFLQEIGATPSPNKK